MLKFHQVEEGFAGHGPFLDKADTAYLILFYPLQTAVLSDLIVPLGPMELPVSSAWMGLRGWAMVCCVVVMMANLYLLYQRPDAFSAFTTTTTTTPHHGLATDQAYLIGSDENSSIASSSSTSSPSSSPSSSPPPSPSPSSSSSPSPVPSPQPERKRYTEVECREQGSFCIYTNLCYDGDQVRMSIPLPLLGMKMSLTHKHA